MDQERRITPSEALNHPFVSLPHMADYAHCSNVKASAHMMEICKRTPGVVSGPSHAAATLMAAAGVRSGNVTLTFNNQLGGSLGGRVAAAVNGLAVRDRTAAYDAHFAQAAGAAQLVPGALLPVPSYPAPSPTSSQQPRVVAVGGGLQQYVPVTMVEQGGRLMVGATWAAAAPSARQMALVPSWQQLPGHHQTQPPPGTLLVSAEDWRHGGGSIRLAQDQVFPVVYDRAGRDVRTNSYSSGSKRSTQHKTGAQATATSSAGHSGTTNSQRQRECKKETVTQLSPVKKRIKENKDHYIGKIITVVGG